MLDSMGTISGNGLLGFFLKLLTQIWNLRVGTEILSGFFALWLLDRIFDIFSILKRR